MKTAFLFYFSKFTETIHLGRFTQIKKKKMWKNKFSEDEFEMTVDV